MNKLDPKKLFCWVDAFAINQHSRSLDELEDLEATVAMSTNFVQVGAACFALPAALNSPALSSHPTRSSHPVWFRRLFDPPLLHRSPTRPCPPRTLSLPRLSTLSSHAHAHFTPSHTLFTHPPHTLHTPSTHARLRDLGADLVTS